MWQSSTQDQSNATAIRGGADQEETCAAIPFIYVFYLCKAPCKSLQSSLLGPEAPFIHAVIKSIVLKYR